MGLIPYVAFFAFLSTENDLHHNLRPNIGGHTSRHNSRVPSKNLNGRGGVFFVGEGRVWVSNKKSLKILKKKVEKEKRVHRDSKNVIIIILIVVNITIEQSNNNNICRNLVAINLGRNA